jgi:hypothetical protein
MALMKDLPTFSDSTTYQEFRAAYDTAQCLIFKLQPVKGTKRKRSPDGTSSSETISNDHLAYVQNILETFNKSTANDQESWCIENEDDTINASTLPTDFLSPQATQNGYCSFILQDDSGKEQSVTTFLEQHAEHATLPVIIPVSSNEQEQDNSNAPDDIFTASPFWLFVGRNTSTTKSMPGRSEHTDGIQHDGTFHYQVAGSKTWNIRPTEELIAMCKDANVILQDSYVHTVQEGDMFLINTRLWWHQTEIPASDEEQAPLGLSISFARDIYLDGTEPGEGEAEYMSNADGAMAGDDTPKGAIILLTGDEPPIRRSTDKELVNCEMVELFGCKNDNKGVQMGLAPTREIRKGEFFIVLDTGSGAGSNDP